MTKGYISIKHIPGKINGMKCATGTIHHSSTGVTEKFTVMSNAAIEMLNSWIDEGYEYLSPAQMEIALDETSK